MKPDNIGKVENVSLHHFSDASELGYGKSRVVPEKFISMQRLELNTAVPSVKMECLLKKELKLGDIK